jgi:hypothetical protein
MVTRVVVAVALASGACAATPSSPSVLYRGVAYRQLLGTELKRTLLGSTLSFHFTDIQTSSGNSEKIETDGTCFQQADNVGYVSGLCSVEADRFCVTFYRTTTCRHLYVNRRGEHLIDSVFQQGGPLTPVTVTPNPS